MSNASLEQAPSSIVVGSVTNFGRYSGAVDNPNIEPSGMFGGVRLKEWHYLSFSGDEAFVAIAVVQLGYLSKAFAYVIDRRADWRIADYSSITPLGRSVTMSSSSVAGSTTFRSGKSRVEFVATGTRERGGWRAELDLQMHDGSRLHGSFTAERGEGFSLVHRLKSGNPAYTHKEAGMSAAADLRWGTRVINGVGLSSSDWTRSLAMRDTRWNWAAFTHRLADNRRVGLNLSAHVYDDRNGESEENVFFVDGRLHTLGGARFALPADPASEAWRVVSVKDGEFELMFEPRGAHHENANALVLRSRFVQPYGVFRGFVRAGGESIDVSGAVGVVEDHLARW